MSFRLEFYVIRVNIEVTPCSARPSMIQRLDRLGIDAKADVHPDFVSAVVRPYQLHSLLEILAPLPEVREVVCFSANHVTQTVS